MVQAKLVTESAGKCFCKRVSVGLRSGPEGGPLLRREAESAESSNFLCFRLFVYVEMLPWLNGKPVMRLLQSRPALSDWAQAEWGRHSLVIATRNMLRVALQEPLNMCFVLQSESSIPLYPPTVVYQQLMSEDKSRINACSAEVSTCALLCAPSAAQRHAPECPTLAVPQDMHLRRFTKRMETKHFKVHHWRLSSQWFALKRKHAEVAVADTEINKAFNDHCYPVFEEEG